MQLLKTNCKEFNLGRSLSCGQAFGWQKKGEHWHGVINQKPCKLRQLETGAIEFQGPTKKEMRNFFSLDFGLKKALGKITKNDSTMKKACACAQGLRLMRQTPFECAVSFICATFANIPRIRKMLENLRKRFGKKKRAFGEEFFLFPTPSALANASEKQLRACGLGYRAPYLKKFAQKIAANPKEFEGLKNKPYQEAKKLLMQHSGIGEKVADCVLLFSFSKGEAFPVDVWIKRAMLHWYGAQIRDKSNSGIAAFARKKWGENAGLAQEYLYCYSRACALKG